MFSDSFPLQVIKKIEYSSLCYTVGPCSVFILLYLFMLDHLKVCCKNHDSSHLKLSNLYSLRRIAFM